jgi:branched-subunit amino acid ABC-type transport system permease component
MGIALQLLFTGLGVGSIYALVALGFVLIYRATNVVNFAQGDFAMLGAFSMVVLCVNLGLPYWLGILVTLVAMLPVGSGLPRLANQVDDVVSEKPAREKVRPVRPLPPLLGPRQEVLAEG